MEQCQGQILLFLFTNYLISNSRSLWRSLFQHDKNPWGSRQRSSEKKCRTQFCRSTFLSTLVSGSVWRPGACFLASLLKFRHARVKVDGLHALLQARVGSLKLTLVEYPTASHIAFILGQWQLPAVGCSSQLFTMRCPPQQLLPHSLICFTLRLFDTLFFPLIVFFPFQCFALFGLSHAPFHPRLAFCVYAFSLSIPLLHHSFTLGGMLQRSLWTTSITTMTSHQGASYDFCFNSTLSGFQRHSFPQRWTLHLCH